MDDRISATFVEREILVEAEIAAGWG